MKLLGIKDKTHFIASIGHHDYVRYADMMMDGGQPGCTDYAGYWRGSGNTCYVEVPQTFAELYTDYQCNTPRERQYGIWPLSQVRLLEAEEYPNSHDWNWIVENAVWGTQGKDGKEPLHYIHLTDAATEHLEAILEDCRHISDDTVKIINHILKSRNEK